MKKTRSSLKPIHPFAARMAPEIAFDALQGLKKGSTVLDPMAGSGVVLRTVSDCGYRGKGFDIDPLSVLMSKVWTTPLDFEKIEAKAQVLINEAADLELKSICLPWIDEDSTTKSFINYWFGRKQINGLRKLSYVLSTHKGAYNDILKVALSRLIITKSKGASLAADVSHSRPHKVCQRNDFDVLDSFAKTCRTLARIFEDQPPNGKVEINQGDARDLKSVADNSISLVITSPPYLNALNYMRGHKMSLVWMGHSIDELGNLKSKTVGIERRPDSETSLDLATELIQGVTNLKALPSRKLGMIHRYALDMNEVIKEMARVIEKKGQATLVVGNSCIEGVFVDNARIIRNSCEMAGLRMTGKRNRDIPPNKRYLPPPSNAAKSSIEKRMRTESVMRFIK
ncbi:MAG: hypothetical protein JST14_07600 [Bacteroidetes bacterium]|nr:hypothetical protein [Bacteroidota bacterium]